MATIGTYGSNTSSYTTMKVEWTSLSATQIRINTTYSLGSATGLYDGNCRDLEVYVYTSGGSLLGSTSVEVKGRYDFWYASHTYYGEATVNIPYQSGVTLKVTVKTVVGTYSTGVNSCRWDATADVNYPSQEPISWPVYNTAPYWGSASASPSSGYIPENQTSIAVSWGAASDDQGDTLRYTVQRISSLGTTTILSNSTSRSVTDSIGSGNQGATYKYRVTVNDGSLWASNPSYIESGTIIKNTFTKATLYSSSSISYGSTGIDFTWSGANNTNGSSSFTYKFSSSDITVYNSSVAVSGSSYTMPIYKSGTAPSGPYIKFDDIKTKFDSSSFIGTLTFKLTTTNAYGSSGVSSKSISVNIQTSPTSFSVNAPTGTYLIGGTSYFIPDRKAVSLSWSASSDPLGTTISYDVQASLSGGSYSTVKSGLTGTSTSITFSQVSEATSCVFRVIAKTGYGTTRTVVGSQITLHYYLPPTVTITGLDRQTTNVTVTATVGFRSSIEAAKTVTSASYTGLSGTPVSLTPSSNLSISESLSEMDTYSMTISVQDAGGDAVGTSETSVSLTIPKYAPILSVREKGVAINDVADSDDYIFKLKGKVLFDADNAGINGLVVKGPDSGNTIISIIGESQGTGVLYVGQSETYGGGIFYNGDGTPAFADGESADRVSLFRRTAGTNIVVAEWAHNSSTIVFKATPTVNGSSVWHSGNDGSGSGLDADKLDGNHASAFSTLGHTHETINVVDIRTVGDGDAYFETLPSDMPDKKVSAHFGYLTGAGSSWRGILTVKGWSGSYAAWQLIGVATSSADDDLYFRSGAGSSWRSPVKIWHSGNDGSGSGLNADLLDGSHASAFASASHAHSYLPLSGGTTTGTTALAGGNLKVYTSGSYDSVIDNNAGGYTEITFRPTGNNKGNIGGSSYYWYMTCSYKEYISSSREYKTNISPMDENDAYDMVKVLPVYKYQSADSDFYDFSVGAMVQDMPIEMLNVSSDDGNSYDSNSATFVLWRAVQKMQKKIEELELAIGGM